MASHKREEHLRGRFVALNGTVGAFTGCRQDPLGH